MRHDMNYRRVLRKKEYFYRRYKYVAASIMFGVISNN